MIAVDTSVWICFFKNDNSDLKTLLNHYLKEQRIIAISAVFGELLQGVKSNKERSMVESFWELLPKIDENDLFIKAGIISNQNKLYNHGIGFTDCYILAVALENKAELWTLDKKLGRMANQISSEI